MTVRDAKINIKYLTEFRYLMYQNPTLPHFFVGLPIRNGATFVTPSVPILALNLQSPMYYSGAEPFYCVNMFNADWNEEEAAATLLPPERLTHSDSLYMVASSSLVWNHGVVACPGILNLVPFTGQTPSAERSLSVRWFPKSTFVTKERLHKGYESLGHLIKNIVFKSNGLAVIEFFSAYSVPIILIGQREVPLVLDSTCTIWVSKLHDEIRTRVYITFEKSDGTADKLTAEKVETFFARSGIAVSVAMQKVREPNCAVLHFNSEAEATEFLAGDSCRTMYMGNREIKAEPYVRKTPKH